MANSDDAKSSSSRASMGSTSLRTLQLSFENLRVSNVNVEIDGSAIPRGDGASSSSPLHVSSILPGPGLSNRVSTTLNAAGNNQPSLYNSASQGSEDFLFGNVNLFGGLSNQNPSNPSHPKSIFALAINEQGSKYLQRMVLLDPRSRQLIFAGVIDYIFHLMIDQYGRYLFQKLIELVDKNMLRMIVGKLTYFPANIFLASMHKYGSYSMKKLINVLQKSPLVEEVVKALSNNFWDLMLHPTGQYVIMECLDVLDSQKNDMLYVQAINECLQLATHERGCISFNNFIARIKGPRKHQLLDLICDHAVYLSQDAFGNFVLQLVMGLQKPSFIDRICLKLRGYYVKLSLHKAGSHLVEQCLKSSGMDHVLQEFLQSNQLVQVARDRYGNYVVQTALRQSIIRRSPHDESLIAKLQPYLNSLQRGYGRKVFTLVTAIIEMKQFAINLKQAPASSSSC